MARLRSTKKKMAARARREPPFTLKNELEISKGIGVALLKENKELKVDKKRLEKDRDAWIKQITTLEDSRITKDQALEKQRTEISELKDALRVSTDYVRMLLKKDEIIKHMINISYDIDTKNTIWHSAEDLNIR